MNLSPDEKGATRDERAAIEGLKQAMDNVVKVIPDSDVARSGENGASKALFAADGGDMRPEHISGYQALLPKTQTLDFFTAGGSGGRAIEHSLGKVVKFDRIAPGPGFRELDPRLHPKRQRR